MSTPNTACSAGANPQTSKELDSRRSKPTSTEIAKGSKAPEGTKVSTGTQIPEGLFGHDLLNNPFYNKGVAFSEEERKTYQLEGLLPPVIKTQDQQEAEVYQRFSAQPDALAKRMYLMSVRDQNERLFFYSMHKHLSEYMPIVYAPTVALSIKNFCDHYTQSRVAYIDVEHPERIKESLCRAAAGHDIRLVVSTDAEGILGIGDWGANGAEILTGKTAVYTAAAAIDPSHILSVMVDAGTNRQELLDDPRYVGLHEKRVRGEKYDTFIDQFVRDSLELWPETLIHWEDFGRPTAAPILERYQKSVLTLNDDIQGTGVTILGAYEATRRIAKTEYKDMPFVVFGAGTAGIGIADQVVDGMVAFGGLSKDEASRLIYLVDRQGLLLRDTPDLTEGQKRYTHDRSEFTEDFDTTDLEAIVRVVKPAGIVGTSTKAGAFTEGVVRTIAANCKHPFIAPISNPTELLECTAAQAIEWSDGRASVITGTPSAPVEYNGITHYIGQGNNALMYPGICLGALIPVARIVSPGMLLAGARALADSVDIEQPGAAVLPPVSDLVHNTHVVAKTVAEQAIKEGLNRREINDVESALQEAAWTPEY